MVVAGDMIMGLKSSGVFFVIPAIVVWGGLKRIGIV